MRAILLAAIRFYKRHLSPRKGFSCAYRVHTGRASCSTLGERAIRRLGVLRGCAVLRARMARCGQEHRRHASADHRAVALRAQRGECDPGCDGSCDGPPGGAGRSCLSQAGQFVQCCDCGSCDWRSKRADDRRRR